MTGHGCLGKAGLEQGTENRYEHAFFQGWIELNKGIWETVNLLVKLKILLFFYSWEVPNLPRRKILKKQNNIGKNLEGGIKNEKLS
jgi:hypothetical protein